MVRGGDGRLDQVGPVNFRVDFCGVLACALENHGDAAWVFADKVCEVVDGAVDGEPEVVEVIMF